MSDSESLSTDNEEDEKKDPNYVDWKNMENIRVICRFRPINSREIREEKSAGLVDVAPQIINGERTVKLVRQNQPQNISPMEFYLDRILGIDTTQQQLYLNVGKPMVEACLEGYNTTIFAYGQTGSGKTYTMFGPAKLKSNNELGCVQRCLSFLFAELMGRKENKAVTEWKVLLHFVQLYREKLMDLLEPDKGIALKIRYDPQTDSPYVPNLKQVDVTELAEVIKLLSVANRNRVTDKTLMNAESSRSHMIMTLTIEQTLKDGTVKKSKLNFADLAGSETYEKAIGGTRGTIDRKKVEELKTINLSLTNLTTCINYLSKGRKASYRSSQLTFYLMDSLGGNSKTTLVVAASPHIFNRSETIRTLRFAKTAKSVKNNAKVNKELSKAQLIALVKKLKRENKKLNARLALFEAELIKNGIDLPVESTDSGKSKKKHKRSKSMKSLIGKQTKTNIFGTAQLTTSTTELLQELNVVENESSDQSTGNQKKSLSLKTSKSNTNPLRELNEAQTNNISNGGSKGTKQKHKKRIFGQVDESAYNKLKSQLKSFQDDLAQQERESNLLNEQLQKKNVELDELTEELQAARDISQQFDALQESKKQIAMQLQSKDDELTLIQSKYESERKDFLSEKSMLEEELNETKSDIQQYESIMDNMKLSNEQLKTEVNSLRESIASLQSEKEKDKKNKKDKKDKKDKEKEELGKANEILSKYFSVTTTNKLNEKQLDDTEGKIETLSKNIINVTKAYEQFTGDNFSINPPPDDQESDDHKKEEEEEDDNKDDDNKEKPKPKIKRKKPPKTSSALQNRMAMFGGGGAVTSPTKKRRKSRPKNKVKEYTESIVKSDPKKNLVFQTERLTHYLNSAMTTIDKQKKLHSEELDTKLNQKNTMIATLNEENKELKSKFDGELNDKDKEIEALKKQIEDLKLVQQNSMLTASMHHSMDEDDDDEDDLFKFNDQLEYLANIGKGYDMDGPNMNQQQQSAHNPTQIALWRQQLQIGSKLDCLDEACLWWTSSITDSDGYKIKVRYDGFDARWDEWVDRGSTRIAPYMTKAKGGRESKGVSVNLKVVAKKKDKRTGKTRRIYKQGFLVKQGKRFKSYKTRYFILMDDGTMEYFKKMTDQSPAGSFNIMNMIETRRIAYPNKKNLYGFEIVTKQRTWRFQAHSDEVVADWIGVIHAVSKGVEPDDDQQQAVIYSGFINNHPDYNKLNVNKNNNNNDNRRNTVQGINGGHQQQLQQQQQQQINGQQRGSRSVTRLSIQEESSSHPPINRAAFSQLMDIQSNNNNLNGFNENGSDDDDNIHNLYDNKPAISNINISIPTNNKSRPDESIPAGSPFIPKSDDEKIDPENLINKAAENEQHSGWMHKAGKWDANWTYRYCVLTVEPVTLRCYVAPNKKQTHCIQFKDVKSCIELKKNSDKFGHLEIPTAFAFQLVTSSRIYTFACKSRHDVNVWLKKIRKVVDVSSSTNTAKLTKRSSIIKFGSTLNKLGTSFGRLIGVTPEHVTTTEVLKTENVQIQKNNVPKKTTTLPQLNEWNNINLNNMNISGISSDRRSSLPILGLPQLQNLNANKNRNNKKKKNRRKSAPDLRALANPQYLRPMSLHELEQEFGIKSKENKTKNDLNREEFEKKIGGRKHRGTWDRDYLQNEQDIAHQKERHTISGKPTQKNKKIITNDINQNIASVLQSMQINDNDDNKDNNDDNIDNKQNENESEEDLSEIE